MSKFKLLIAEDNSSIQELYKKAFWDNDFEKRIAGNGLEALEIYESWKPDIVVLDIMMPHMTGIAVAERIRKGFRDFSTTIVMATALHDLNSVKQCLDNGIQGYVIKPFDYKTVKNKILGYHDETTSKAISKHQNNLKKMWVRGIVSKNDGTRIDGAVITVFKEEEDRLEKLGEARTNKMGGYLVVFDMKSNSSVKLLVTVGDPEKPQAKYTKAHLSQNNVVNLIVKDG